MKTLTIIDTFGFFFRSYYALPKLNNSNGFPTGMLTGFANFILNIQEEYPTDYILFALDSKGKTFRHDIYKNYKANRPEAPLDLKKQLIIAIEWIRKMGFKDYEISGYEADDIIASAVQLAISQNIKVQIVTHDKDLYQLILDPYVVIYNPTKKIQIDSQGCLEKYGIEPSLVRDFLAIAGDSSDNIPGVKGIGDKGAKKLIDQFGDLESIYENIENIANPRTKQLLIEGKENAFISKQLTSLYDKLNFEDEISNFIFPSNPLLAIQDDLEKFNLNKILSKITNKNLKKEIHLNYKTITLNTKEDLENVLKNITPETLVAFDTETTSIDSNTALIVGFSFAFNEEVAYYVPINHRYLGVEKQITMDDAKKAIEKIYKSFIIGQNLKYDFKVVLNNFSLPFPKNIADTMLLAWLLNPNGSVGMDYLAKNLLKIETIKFKDLVKKNQTFADVDIETATKYAAEDAWITLKLYKKLIDLLDPILIEEANNIEYPFINVLGDMEKNGIKINTSFLRNLLLEVDNVLEKITKEIYNLSNTKFNINSVKQLGVVLFETLRLPIIKKTKTGYGTDELVLNELLDKHPIIQKILDYRENFKLKTTYIEPLIKLSSLSNSSRVHTSFLQTGTATGRLSSKEPNLQNIPVRTELGSKIREGFIAQEGFLLVGLDYSQIELRLLAHFSQDTTLVQAFKEDKDIHLETSLKLFGEENAKDKRNVAKSINFGLLYGMGQRKLAKTLGISTQEAKEYILNYFASFPTVKNHIESIKELAKKQGFVETIFKRRRYFDFENATPMLFASYERESVNTIFQGSAADLIKLAMIKISKEILDENAKLLLQIHDELIFEVKEENADEFSKKAKHIMENIYPLHIPLKTSIAIGKNWQSLK